MRLIIEDIMLVDSPSQAGGKAWEGETLGEFVSESESITLDKLNRELAECGIEPITLEQIAIIGVEGE